MNAVRAAQLRL